MRRLLKRIFWLGCLAGTAAAVWLYSYFSNDEFVRQRVLTLLQEKCPGADLQLRAARRNSDQSISLVGLHFRQQFANADVALDVPEVTLKLSTGQAAPDVASVLFSRPHLRVAGEADRIWQSEAGWLDKLASDLPPVRVHEGTVEIVQQPRDHAAARGNTSATLGAAAGATASPASDDETEGDHRVLLLRNINLQTGFQADHSWLVAGTAHSDLFDQADLAARVNASKKGWALSIDLQGVRFDRNLHLMLARYLPVITQRYVAAAPRSGAGAGAADRNDKSVIRPVSARAKPAVHWPGVGALGGWAIQGRGRLRLTLHRTAIDQPLLHQLAVKLENASLAGPLLPFPLHGIDALAVYRNGVAKLLEFRGHNGATEISARGKLPLPALSPEASAAGAALFVKAENLELDERLRSRLPPVWRRQWDRYRPAGTVHVEFNLLGSQPYRFHGAVLHCLDASFRFDKFPYRLEHVTGTIEQQDASFNVNLSAPAGGGKVRLTGTVRKPGPGALVSLNIDAERVPLDDPKLLRALAPEAREILSKLNARGPAAVHWRVRRDDARKPFTNSARIVLNGSSVRWKGYPIDRIEGTLELADGTWRSSSLRGRNDDGWISASGTLGPREEGFPLELTLRGEYVELERELRDTLAPRWRELWQKMVPVGRCDFLANLTGARGREIKLQQLQVLPRDVSFQPVAFAVRFDGLHCGRGGRIRILPDPDDAGPDRKGRVAAQPIWKVDFQGLQASHGTSRWRCSGSLRVERSGRHRLTLQQFAVERLVFDEQILAALPEELARACRQLNPIGPSLQLREAGTDPALVLEWSDAGQASHRANWNLVLLCDDATFDIAGGMRGVTGAVTFDGIYRDATLECLGEIALDRCTWRDLQFTNLHGPLWIRKSQPGAAATYVVLGNWQTDEKAPVQRQLTSTARSVGSQHLSATLIGGRIIGDIRVRVGRRSAYDVRAHLDGGRLEQYAAQILPGRKHVRGRLTADWYLRSSPDPDHVTGWGYLVAEDGDLYELPLVFNLLPVAWNILNLKRPESPSVHSGSVFLLLRPGWVDVQQMELVSDTITFRGKGRMTSLNADSPIKLIFSPMVTTNRARVPLIGNLIDRASKELVAIRVEGSLREPRVRPHYIPNVDGAIQEIGSMGDTGIRRAVETLRRILGVEP